jgi:DNA repair protein RadA/Sms
MLLAVLSRHSELGLDDHDVFVSTVGGITLLDTAADLPVVLALAGSRRGEALPAHLLAFGEIDLTGEVRPVARAEERLAEARKQGFRIAVVPLGNAPRRPPQGLSIITVSRVEEAIQAAFTVPAASGMGA